MYKVIIISVLSLFVFFSSCNTDNITNDEMVLPLSAKKATIIDSLLSSKFFKSKSKIINDTCLIIEMILPKEQTTYYRRRGFIIDFSIFSIRNNLDKISNVKVFEFENSMNGVKLIDSAFYNSSDLGIIREWEKNDGIYLYLMARMLELDYKKYDELSTIALFVADSLCEGEFKKDFYPDFTFFLDGYISEIYGERENTKYRKYMEYLYYYSHETSKFKYLKPNDIKPFLDYGDLNNYSKKYPKELEKIKELRKSIPKKWTSIDKTI